MQSKMVRAMALFVLVLTAGSAINLVLAVWQFSDHNLPDYETKDFVPGALWWTFLPNVFMAVAFLIVLRGFEKTFEIEDYNEQIMHFQYVFVMAVTAYFSSAASSALLDFSGWFSSDIDWQVSVPGYILPNLAIAVGLSSVILQIYAWSGWQKRIESAAREPAQLRRARRLSIVMPIFAIWFATSAALLHRELNGQSVDWSTLTMILTLMVVLFAIAQTLYWQSKKQMDYALAILNSSEDDEDEDEPEDDESEPSDQSEDSSAENNKKIRRERFVYGAIFAISLVAFSFGRDGFTNRLWELTKIAKSKLPETLFELTDSTWWITVGVPNLLLVLVSGLLTVTAFQRWVYGSKPQVEKSIDQAVSTSSGAQE